MIPTRSREWMIEIGKKRKYKNMLYGEQHPRCKVPNWKVQVLRDFTKMPRVVAQRLGDAMGISAGYVYQLWSGRRRKK